jgi:hypothetical protein
MAELVCLCVCVRERERERERVVKIFLYFETKLPRMGCFSILIVFSLAPGCVFYKLRVRKC